MEKTTKTTKETKRIQTTDKKTDSTFTIADLVEITDVSHDELNKSIIFVRSGVSKAAWDIVLDWFETGQIVDRIKKSVANEDFKRALDCVYGTSFNNNQRAYCVRLSHQPLEALKAWYMKDNIQAIGCKLVFELFCKANPDIAVGAPKSKTEEKETVKTESGETVELPKEITFLKVSQAFTLYKALRDKCSENGDINKEGLEALHKALEMELDEVSQALAIEIKADAVQELREVKEGREIKLAKTA